MRLYMATPAEYAALVVHEGFTVGRPFYDPRIDGFARTAHLEYCDFKDQKPVGRSLPGPHELANTNVFQVRLDGPILLDDPGDFVLSIEVPDEFALEVEVHSDHPKGRSSREFWLAPEEANRYPDTLRVYDSQYGEVVRPDLVGK